MLKWNRGKKEAAKPVAISLSISQMNWWFHAWLVIFIFCFCFFVFFRWTTLSLPCAGMRTSLYSVVEFAAASTQSRRPIGTGQKSAVSMRHLWQRIRDRVITTHPHGQGTRSFSYEFICLCVASSLSVSCVLIYIFTCLFVSSVMCPCYLAIPATTVEKKPLPFEFSIGPSKKWKTKQLCQRELNVDIRVHID